MMGSFPDPYLWFPKGDLDTLGEIYADPYTFFCKSCILPLRRPKVQILNWSILLADSSKFRIIGENLQELARGPLTIGKISENEKNLHFWLSKQYYILKAMSLLGNVRVWLSLSSMAGRRP